MLLLLPAGVESNGAGKTALMMAPLWALTGSVDSRAEVRRGWSFDQDWVELLSIT